MLTDEQMDELKVTNIYRFRSPTDYNFQSLLEKKIYASTPNVLNDPLDCGITYNLDKLYKKLITKKRFLEYISSYTFRDEFGKKLYRELSKIEGLEEYLHSDSTSMKKEFFVKRTIEVIARTIIFELRDCFGVVSFTLNPGSSVMWSHYASNFTGFVLGYNFKTLNEAVNKAFSYSQIKGHCKDLYGFHLVNYVTLDEMVDGTDLMYELLLKRIAKNHNLKTMLDFAAQSKNYRIFLSLLTTKDKSWDYEQEVRLILPRDDFYYPIMKTFEMASKPYFEVASRYAPDEITIGMNMSPNNKAIIGYYCLLNNKTHLWLINDSQMMSERVLYKNRIRASALLQ